ncbi:probable ubiquitin carboxyl-terminal hydrolase 17 at C-terminar half [Coccomyxa sp. Obi]|nr:probable ubiquitin carboxyl-terminal hydrolase 17 at C-terminar half [Coccomyxa sp. Obi]
MESVMATTSQFERPLEENETPLERAKSLSWLHLLAAMPILMAHLSGRDPARLTAAVQTARIALALMAGRCKRWEALILPHGLSLWEYEVVVRMHQSQAIFNMPAGMPTSAVPIYAPIFKANAERIYSVQPTNKWNILFCHMLEIGRGKQCQVLRKAIKIADDEGDDSSSIRLRYALCHAILLGAEGPSFSPKAVMSIINKAVGAMDDKAEFWTVPDAMSMLQNVYWPCTAAVVHFSTTIKQDPFSFGNGRMPAFASAADLEREKRHVMCAYCGTMCCLLTRCSTCHNVGYCSSECQIKHWKAGHKHACKLHKQPGIQCGA